MAKRRGSSTPDKAHSVAEVEGRAQAPVAPPPADQTAEIGELVRLVMQETITIRSGPLPSPQELKEYEQVSPGLVGDIVAMAKEEATHRRTMERKEQQSTHRLQAIGQAVGFAVIAASLVLVWFEKAGAPWVAISALAALAGAFVWSKRGAQELGGVRSGPPAVKDDS